MLRSKLGNKYPTWKYFIVKKCIALRLCLLNRRNAQGCARSKGKACVSERSDGKDQYRKGESTGGDKEKIIEREKVNEVRKLKQRVRVWVGLVIPPDLCIPRPVHAPTRVYPVK